jgi:hypothetical protein
MPARKCHVPAIGVMAETSSVESHESLPHGQASRDSMSKPHDLSPQASVPDIAPRAEPGLRYKLLRLQVGW